MHVGGPFAPRCPLRCRRRCPDLRRCGDEALHGGPHADRGALQLIEFAAGSDAAPLSAAVDCEARSGERPADAARGRPDARHPVRRAARHSPRRANGSAVWPGWSVINDHPWSAINDHCRRPGSLRRCLSAVIHGFAGPRCTASHAASRLRKGLRMDERNARGRPRRSIGTALEPQQVHASVSQQVGSEEWAPLLTASEVAVVLRTSRKAVYAMAERAQLPGVTRIGRRLLVRRDDLLSWLDERRAASPGGIRR